GDRSLLAALPAGGQLLRRLAVRPGGLLLRAGALPLRPHPTAVGPVPAGPGRDVPTVRCSRGWLLPAASRARPGRTPRRPAGPAGRGPAGGGAGAARRRPDRHAGAKLWASGFKLLARIHHPGAAPVAGAAGRLPAAACAGDRAGGARNATGAIGPGR